MAMVRVGAYIAELEHALSTHTAAPPPVTMWEEPLASAARRPGAGLRPQAGWSDFGAIRVFSLLAAGAISLGASRAWTGNKQAIVTAVLAETVLLVVVVYLIGDGVARARAEAHRMSSVRVGSADSRQQRLAG
jgi:hypothetical protein